MAVDDYVDGPRTVGMRARPTDESGWAAPGPWTVRARPTDDGWRDCIDNCDLTTELRRRLDSDGWQNGPVTRTDFDDDWIPLAPDFDGN